MQGPLPMTTMISRVAVSATIVGAIFFSFSTSTPSARADEGPGTKKAGKAQVATGDRDKDELPALNLLEAARAGTVSLNAEGTGDGRMTLSVTNKTKRQLRVVLPPGLIAAGATGQF